jgi:hypothetical protein
MRIALVAAAVAASMAGSVAFSFSEGVPAETIVGKRAFSFVALGDMPYDVPADYAKFDRLIGAINALKPAFSVHVGDIKGGGACTDALFNIIYDKFQSFEGALVYTPGDNDWTDCHRFKVGGVDDPRERLSKLRELFFAKPQQSLGKEPIAVENEGQTLPKYGKFVENVRFWKDHVLFVTLNIPGSNNGFETVDFAAAKEFFERNPANLAWIEDSFRKATLANAKALVFAFQANPYNVTQPWGGIPAASGFVDTVNAIERGALAFGKPVLVVQGDNHALHVSAFHNAKGKPVPNVLRLQVFGEKDVHAVRVIVDPDSPGVFGFMPLVVPANGAINMQE